MIRRVVTFSRNRNFDLYILLASAVGLAAVELWNEDWTTALFAGVLAAFAWTLVLLRHDIGHIRSTRSGLASVFLHETPVDVVHSFERAIDLLLVGVSLDRALRDAFTPLESFLRRQGTLKVLLVNPDSDWAVRTADRRAYQEHGPQRRKEHIKASMASFQELQQRTGGDVELRVTEDPLTFGATMIDGYQNTRETRIVVQHYSYKKREAREPNPVFIVRPTDGEWFAEFREELENLWNDGEAPRGRGDA